MQYAWNFQSSVGISKAFDKIHCPVSSILQSLYWYWISTMASVFELAFVFVKISCKNKNAANIRHLKDECLKDVHPFEVISPSLWYEKLITPGNWMSDRSLSFSFWPTGPFSLVISWASVTNIHRRVQQTNFKRSYCDILTSGWKERSTRDKWK